jgi:oxaloacetate decarboxylase alpha subunit
LTYALFPQVGLRFLQHRGDPSAFEPAPKEETAPPPRQQAAPVGGAAVYSVRVNGKAYTVEVAESGQLKSVTSGAASGAQSAGGDGQTVRAVLAGNVLKVNVTAGDTVVEGEPVLVVEAMKMETAVSAPAAGRVSEVFVKQGDAVKVGDALLAIA